MTRLVFLDASRTVWIPPEVVASLRGGGMAIFPRHALRARRRPVLRGGALEAPGAKGRDRGKPIPLLLSGKEEAERWTRHIPTGRSASWTGFGPAPSPSCCPRIRGSILRDGGGDTVGLRVRPSRSQVLARGLPAPSPEHPRTVPGTRGTGGPPKRSSGIHRDVDWVLWAGPRDELRAAGYPAVGRTGANRRVTRARRGRTLLRFHGGEDAGRLPGAAARGNSPVPGDHRIPEERVTTWPT